MKTVKGCIPSADLGITLPHEHLLVDVTNWCIEPSLDSKRYLVNLPVTIEILGELRRDSMINKDNMKLDDVRLAVEELFRFKRSGGNSLVEATVPGIGRRPQALRDISDATNINIICGTGWYLDSTLPSFVRKRSVQELCDLMIKELTEGIDNTHIKAGVIGELGCSDPWTKDERKVLRAASRAQAETGAGLTIHVGIWNPETKEREIKKANEYLDLIQKEGADLNKVYLSHMDVTCSDLKYHESIINRYGVTLEYDGFGWEFYSDSYYPGALGMSDKEQLKSLVELLKKGYEQHLLISQDVCSKMSLTAYGGYGYAHILDHIIPCLKYSGVDDKQIRAILIDNPKRILSF